MRVYKLSPEDASQKLSISYAMSQAYKVLLDSDGNAEISKPDGTTYHVQDFRCDCPDAHNRDGGSYTKGDTDEHVCKHSLWVAQLHPCPDCNATMLMRDLQEGVQFYGCHNCKAVKAAMLVKLERQQEARKRLEIDEMLKAGAEAAEAVFAD
ncbi:MAG: hypothetical protein O3B73_10125 [bacterium]|nr:hypothetical protein [bacterium]